MTTVLNMNIDTGSHNYVSAAMIAPAIFQRMRSLTRNRCCQQYVHGPTINRQPLEANELWRVM